MTTLLTLVMMLAACASNRPVAPSAPPADTGPWPSTHAAARADVDDDGSASEPSPSVPSVADDAPPVEPAPAPISADDRVEALLDEIEHAGDGIRTFTAAVRYEVVDDLLPDDKVIREGDLIYDAGGDAGRRIAVLFNRRIVNRRLREQVKHYVFSGRWLVEIDADDRTFDKYEIAPPGEMIDPLKLGEGPFPLPVGQAKADVLERFTVTEVALPEGGPLGGLLDEYELDGLRLRPRDATAMAEEIEHVDLFYDRATRIPVGVELISVTGKRKTATLKDLRFNPELDVEAQAKLSVETPPGEDWRVTIRPFEKR